MLSHAWRGDYVLIRCLQQAIFSHKTSVYPSFSNKLVKLSFSTWGEEQWQRFQSCHYFSWHCSWCSLRVAQDSVICIWLVHVYYLVAGPQPLLFDVPPQGEIAWSPIMWPSYECFLSQTINTVAAKLFVLLSPFWMPSCNLCRDFWWWSACLYMLDDLYFIALMMMWSSIFWKKRERFMMINMMMKLVRRILWLIPLAVPSLEVYLGDNKWCCCQLFKSVIEHVVCTSV